MCQSLFFNKVATLFKNRLWLRCFPVNFVKFLRPPFLTQHLRWLILTNQNLLQCLETYSEPKHLKLNFFCKNIYSYKLLIIFAKSSILDIKLSSEYSSGFRSCNYFLFHCNKYIIVNLICLFFQCKCSINTTYCFL